MGWLIPKPAQKPKIAFGLVGKQIWVNFPKKNGYIFGGLPLVLHCNSKFSVRVNLESLQTGAFRGMASLLFSCFTKWWEVQSGLFNIWCQLSTSLFGNYTKKIPNIMFSNFTFYMLI